MKRKVTQICSLVGLLIALMVSAQAQIGTQYRAHIPFDFNVGNQTFPAGDYIIGVMNRMSGAGALTIRDARTSEAKVVQVTPKGVNPRRAAAKLVFSRYENLYFLAEMTTPTLSTEIQRTKDEKRLAGNQKPRQETVAMKK